MKLALVALMSTSLVVIAWAAPMEQQHVVREYEDWRHESNDEMIEALKRFGHIASPKVESVMRSIDRRRFIERPIMNNPYWDIPQSLGFGSVMSSPKVHAQALEILKDYLKPGAKVLDIGSGSGYLTACMAHMVGPTGKVYAVEHIEDLVAQANKSMHTYYPNLMEGGRVQFVDGDGREGHAAEGPYDVIYVGGAVHHYPFKLIQQLVAGGKLLSAVGLYGEQSLMLYTKNEKDLKISAIDLGDTKFMHLSPKDRQLDFWKPIISNKNYPKVDPMYILLQKKIRETEGKVDREDEKTHKFPYFKNWAIAQPNQKYRQM
ncbi:protein-L-isoaspartate(D-aspartate) O-methyltransferase-like isoform X3 [Diaphorina citri]|uniref:protein-L-isoaspartate(D-aspartate) O-methyltransferase n=1 Tax=Diaphorina citri TaxID=121845 RepID=A0A1S4E7H9_DIACI|nr:protein-L-isoaspartate(D-aspartate) O-methyltransferase-like isoform X3 [Diaphorina citri]